jgi:hypothetical protein
MPEIRTRHLFDMALQVSGMQPIGATPNGNRRIGLVAGGTFAGERLRGTVLPGGADWIIARPNGCTTLDVRLVLQTDYGAAIGMIYRGLRHGPAEIMQRLDRGRRSIRPSTISAPRSCSRPLRPSTTGSTASSRSAPEAARPRDRFTRFMRCSERTGAANLATS